MHGTQSIGAPATNSKFGVRGWMFPCRVRLKAFYAAISHKMLLATGPGLWQHPWMDISKKLTRADVYKQIDAFRGIVKQSPGDKPSAEQWAESKRAEKESAERKFERPEALSGKFVV
jgi:hypothetical protein